DRLFRRDKILGPASRRDCLAVLIHEKAVATGAQKRMDLFLVRGHFHNQSRTRVLEEALAPDENPKIGSIGVNFHELDARNAAGCKNAVHGYEVAAHLGSCALINQLDDIAKSIPVNGL